jgi:hypothetical protein
VPAWTAWRRKKRRHETIETIDDISRKNPAARPLIVDSATGDTNMLKPTFRLFIIPLGAVVTLASMSAQNTAPRAQHDGGTLLVREQVVDCSLRSPSEICVIPDRAR